jgi:hypothetical protein
VEKYKACCGLTTLVLRAAIGANQCSVSLCAKSGLAVINSNRKVSKNIFIYMGIRIVAKIGEYFIWNYKICIKY